MGAPEPLPFHIGLAGPTAVGKSAAALAIAQQYGCEIISVDSALVYRDMDIGTAKPSPAERARVAHHLIDIRDAAESYSAADFVRDARACMQAITARGHWPLLVGGTMLYFKALREGLDDLPPANAAVRAAIDQEAQHKGWPALHAELACVDPVTAQRLAPLDRQRIQRALEVWRLSQRPLSDFHSRTNSSNLIANNDHPTRAGCLISMEPRERAWLHARIAQRFDTMMQAGLVQEVVRLRERGDLHIALPSMRCVGYRQVWQALDQHPAQVLATLPALREQTLAATRQLAKRQLTWLRALPTRTVIDAQAPDATAQVLRAVQRQLALQDQATSSRRSSTA